MLRANKMKANTILQLFSGELQKHSTKYMLCLGFLLLTYQLEGPKLVQYQPEKASIEITC